MDKSILLVTVAVASAGALVILWHLSKQDRKAKKTPGGIGIHYFHIWTFSNQKAYLSSLMEKGISLSEAFASLYTPISQVAQLHGGVERYVEKLLQRELPAMSQTLALKSRISESFQMLLGKNNDVDQALQNFLEIIPREIRDAAGLPRVDQALQDFLGTDYLPTMLGWSIAHMLCGKPPKGINMLRAISRMPHSDEFSDEFECAYLLLANVYMQKSAFDLASYMYGRCLDQNRSCLEALQGLGDTNMVDGAGDDPIRDANNFYDKAWQLVAKQEHHASLAPIGFKLAQSHMKMDQFDKAIDVCCKVTSTLQTAPAS